MPSISRASIWIPSLSCPSVRHAGAAIVLVLTLSSPSYLDRALAGTDPPADFRLTGESGGSEDLFGWSAAAAGDVNGDSFPDLVLGAPSSDEIAGFAGRAYLFYGPFTGDRSATDANATISAVNFGDNLGIAVDGAGDLNGDGKDDLVIGARSNDAAGIRRGATMWTGTGGTAMGSRFRAVFSSPSSRAEP